MNFVRYNPETGEILNAGFMDEQFVLEEIQSGKPTLLLSDPTYFPYDSKRVNLETLTLEDIPLPIDTGG